MAYNQFTLQRAVADFGLQVRTLPDLFPGVPPVPVPAELRGQLPALLQVATVVNTEAMRTQLVVAPLLTAVWRAAAYELAYYVGTRFDVDDAAGLVGVCDYVLGRPPQLDFITAPVLFVVEAKNQHLAAGLGQCAAELVAATKFNTPLAPHPRPVYGAVSDAADWQFLRLDGQRLDIGLPLSLPADPDRIYGILLHVCGIHPAQQPPA